MDVHLAILEPVAKHIDVGKLTPEDVRAFIDGQNTRHADQRPIIAIESLVWFTSYVVTALVEAQGATKADRTAAALELLRQWGMESDLPDLD